MFNTLNAENTDNKKINGTNPFDSALSSTDPFGISTTMKISESSEKFDDNPFNTHPTSSSTSIRPRSGKEALSSSNWLAYQHSMDDAHLDSVEDLHETSLITQANNINLNNPFLTSSTDQSSNTSFPSFPVDFFFDKKTESTKTSKNPFDNLDENPSSDDPFGLNESTISSSTNTMKNDNNVTDASPFGLSTGTEKSISEAAFSHPMSMGFAPQASTNTSAAQTTSDSKLNNEFVDWFTQSEQFTHGNESTAMKSTTDTFGHTYRPPQSLSTLKENSQENVPSPPTVPLKRLAPRPSIDDVPSIRVEEPTTEHNESNVVPRGYFDKPKKKQSEDDSDEDTKMVFKIGEKKANTSADVNIPIPILLPPPPTSSSMKTSKSATDDGSSSSSSSEAANDDDDDPLAIFRSKPIKDSTQPKQGKNLITDWEEEEPSNLEEKQPPPPKAKLQSPPSVDYYLHEPDYDDSAPLEAYHNDISELQLQQLSGWLLQIRSPFRQKDVYKSTFQRFSDKRTWQECYVRIFFDEKKLRFYLPQTIEQSFAEIELQTWYQCTKPTLQQYDQFTKIHTFKIFEANYREIPQVRIDRLVTLPEKFFRKFTRPNKAQQVLLDHANCVQQEIVKFGQMNYTYLKQFSIILDDLFWSMPVTRTRLQKHLKEEITVKILDEYFAHIDKYRHICKQKSRTRIFLLAFLNGTEPIVEIGINDWFRHGKEVNKRNEIIINRTLQEYWIKPEQVELASIIDAAEYENTHLLRLIPPDSQKIEIMRFRTRPKQNIELPIHVYCFMSVIDRQVNIRIEVTVSNAFNISILSKASSMATNDKTANVREDNSDEQCPCEDIQIRFPIPDPWVYMFRVEKRFRYGAIHSVRRKAGKIKGLDRLMVHRNDSQTPLMAASAGVAKYEQAFRAIVWRIDQLPKRDQGAYKTHIFECGLTVPSHDPIPDKYEPIADVEYSMAQAFVSHCQIRSVAVPTADETPEKWIRPRSRFTYTIDIEYAFKEEEKKEFAPIELDMKDQTMSQSETENNSQSDDSD